MPDYGFRPVTAADLPMLAEWLRVPQVARWWPDAERQLALIRAHLELTADGQAAARSRPRFEALLRESVAKQC